ncbi:DUF3440 domain-containing protein [Campylobacter sp. RM12640]|uniref:DUF3440 domain-containing protein n=1 Tax=unclassified Campylobacter TaxID=2593542 RepID=UPI0030142700|nr:DUF3440 domain-containing protein [Campylobacter sp. RM12640]MBZ7990042.1 DUF3440 domain-containing protein [Campylobacter sp. RM12635]
MKTLGKTYIDKNVYDSACDRISFIMRDFKNVCISFSGGKDSTLLANLVLDYKKKHPDNKTNIYLYHMDYEAQYSQTTAFVQDFIKENKKYFKQIFYICMPVKAQCAISWEQTYWQPWKLKDKEKWLFTPPTYAITEENHNFSFWDKENPISDYEFNIEFAFWLQEQLKVKDLAFLIGIRADESLNRFRAIAQSKSPYKGYKFSTKMGEKLYNFYPIYDWTTQDIWVANFKFNYKYNPVYDLFFKAGLKPEQMRVASAFNDCAINVLNFFRVLDPNNWAKMLHRINGVDFASKYGDTQLVAWRNVKLPKNHTWKSYLEFLLNALPPKLAESYQKKFNTSLKFWAEKGGALKDETLAELDKLGIKYEKKGKISKISSKEVVTFGDYPDDADVKEFASVPSYKRMCVCILKNDFVCKYMGFAPTKEQQVFRQIAEKKYKEL